MPKDLKVRLMNKGIYNIIDAEDIPREASSDALNFITDIDGFELTRGQVLEGNELTGANKVHNYHFAYTKFGILVQFRRINTKIQYLDGATWTDVAGDLNTARRALAGCGAQNAGLSFGGYDGATWLAETEEYNGATWTDVAGDLNTGRGILAGCGTQVAGLSFGGYTGDYTAETEEYNGVTWTDVAGDLNIARDMLAGCGSQAAGLSFGGSGGTYLETEEYDGSTWTITGDLNTLHYMLAGAGTQTAGLSFGGWDAVTPYMAETEEYI